MPRPPRKLVFMVTVLVTGAGALLGQGIIRSLRASSLDARIVAVDPSPLAVGLYWADVARLVPMAKDPSYLDSVEAVLEEERPDALLVGTDTELAVFAEHQARLERTYGTKIVVSSQNVIGIADDKWRTVEFLRDNEFAYPDSCLPEEPGALDALISRVGFPLIVKPRTGARSVGVTRVPDRAALDQAVGEADGLIVQECVGTAETEFTAGVLRFEGQPTMSIVMRRHLRDGNTYRAFVEPYPELNRWVRDVAEALDPYGPANFQFMTTDDGPPKLFEINARYSGTTPLRAQAGFNEVEIALRHILNGEPLSPQTFEPLTILRSWTETVISPGELVEERPKARKRRRRV